jgi:DNA (cytosine-5)-methyltransferase 1
MAGYDERLAVEWDKHAAQVFKENFGSPIYHGDIASLSGEECMQRAGLAVEELDVLDGSPPCQGFSASGRRKLNDARNNLFREYVRLLAALHPKALVMENVAGLVRGKMRLIFRDIVDALNGAGYVTRAAILDAAYFGVPQHRQRLIIIGIRKDVGAQPDHPKATTTPLTVRYAVDGATVEPDTPTLNDKYGKLWAYIKRPPMSRRSTNAASLLGSGFNNCVVVNPDRAAPTIMKQQGGKGFGTMVHWSERRPLSTSEAKRICSFPDEFKLPGKYRERWARMGNSVPPLLMRAIAKRVRQSLCGAG